MVFYYSPFFFSYCYVALHMFALGQALLMEYTGSFTTCRMQDLNPDIQCQSHVLQFIEKNIANGHHSGRNFVSSE